jgi:hypothetical protein
MDYARYNYIAQPGDTGVRLTPPEIGEQDYFLIKWTYKWVPGVRDEWEEAPIVESWVDAVAGDPVHRYGRQQFGITYDPSALAEDLGNDPIRAGDYGIANLKYILAHLDEWITDDTDYQHRRGLYYEIREQYYRYIRAVMMQIGGIYLTDVKQGTRGERIVPVPREVQRASLHWIMDQYRDMDWLDAPALRRNLGIDTGGAPQMRSRVVGLFQGQIEKVVLCASFSSAPYTVHEFLDDLYNETWRHLHSRREPTNAEKILQKSMVEMYCAPLVAMNGAGDSETAIAVRAPRVPEAHGVPPGGDTRFGPAGMNLQSSADVSDIDDSESYLIELAIRSQERLRRAIRHSSGASQAHYMALLMRLNVALKDKL